MLPGQILASAFAETRLFFASKDFPWFLSSSAVHENFFVCSTISILRNSEQVFFWTPKSSVLPEMNLISSSSYLYDSLPHSLKVSFQMLPY